MGNPLTFKKIGKPYASELYCKLHKPRSSISSGSLKTIIEFTLDLNDNDHHELRAILALVIEGMVKGTEEKAFTVSVTMECEYTFVSALTETEYKDPSFVRKVCEPLYHRAATVAEQNARTVGLSSVNVPTTFPDQPLEMSTVPTDELPVSPRKKAKSKVKEK